MRGRGRGSAKSSRGSSVHTNAGRTSTRNWDVSPATQSGKPVARQNAKSGDRSGIQWLPSVSRSSGLEPNGDALRSFETQEEYWKYIVEKIHELESPNQATSEGAPDRQEKEANVMILLRKLREGFVSTKRKDEFAVKVVERSTCLALVYASPINTASSFSHLLDTYPTSSKDPPSTPNQHAIGLLCFLHTLVNEYPSQQTTYRLLRDRPAYLPHDCPEWSVASDISCALRRSNWWTLSKLTSPDVLHKRLAHEPWVLPRESDIFDALPRRALSRLLHDLRVKIRDSAWPVLRSAYREVVDGPWLERSLMLEKQAANVAISDLTEFMRLRVEKGEAGVKDTAGIRAWILRRPG